MDNVVSLSSLDFVFFVVVVVVQGLNTQVSNATIVNVKRHIECTNSECVFQFVILFDVLSLHMHCCLT